MESKVILVDENDEVLGEAEKLLVHEFGLLHRAFSIFIYRFRDNVCEVLMQKRHPSKYHSGGLWTNTCCSHPRPNETILESANRRLKEELGITASLKEIGTFIYNAVVGNDLVEYELDHVLIGEMSDQDIRFDPEEIAETAWVEINALKEDYKNNKSHYTAWFSKAFEMMLKNIDVCKM